MSPPRKTLPNNSCTRLPQEAGEHLTPSLWAAVVTFCMERKEVQVSHTKEHSGELQGLRLVSTVPRSDGRTLGMM